MIVLSIAEDIGGPHLSIPHPSAVEGISSRGSVDPRCLCNLQCLPESSKPHGIREVPRTEVVYSIRFLLPLHAMSSTADTFSNIQFPCPPMHPRHKISSAAIFGRPSPCSVICLPLSLVPFLCNYYPLFPISIYHGCRLLHGSQLRGASILRRRWRPSYRSWRGPRSSVGW